MASRKPQADDSSNGLKVLNAEMESQELAGRNEESTETMVSMLRLRDRGRVRRLLCLWPILNPNTQSSKSVSVF